MNPAYIGPDPQEEKQAALDRAVADACDAAMAAPVTDDDIYEFGCMLETGKENANRDKLRRLLDSLNNAKYTREAQAELVGFTVLDMLNENRAHRAEQRFWDEQ